MLLGCASLLLMAVPLPQHGDHQINHRMNTKIRISLCVLCYGSADAKQQT